MRPFLPLAERLGQLYASLAAGVPDVLEIKYQGQLADADTRILTLSVLKGVFGRVSDEPVQLRERPAARHRARHRGARVLEPRRPGLRQPGDASAAATTPRPAPWWACGARPAS